MNPVVFRLGTFEVHAFTFWLALGVILSSAVILIPAWRRKDRLMPWVDVLVCAVGLGTLGARLGHVGLNWAYFSDRRDEILSITSGGLDWHGALLGSLVGLLLISLLRRLSWRGITDAFALVFPIAAITVWIACASANAAYGVEVRTLADFPNWLVIESADVYGVLAPRINLVPPGMLLAVFVALMVYALSIMKRSRGTRLWMAILVYSLGMALIEFFRADYVPIWFGHRADQVLDLLIALFATLWLVLVILRRGKRASIRHQDSPQNAARPALLP